MPLLLLQLLSLLLFNIAFAAKTTTTTTIYDLQYKYRTAFSTLHYFCCCCCCSFAVVVVVVVVVPFKQTNNPVVNCNLSLFLFSYYHGPNLVALPLLLPSSYLSFSMEVSFMSHSKIIVESSVVYVIKKESFDCLSILYISQWCLILNSVENSTTILIPPAPPTLLLLLLVLPLLPLPLLLLLLLL